MGKLNEKLLSGIEVSALRPSLTDIQPLLEKKEDENIGLKYDLKDIEVQGLKTIGNDEEHDKEL
jgi:hypothetical protein